MGFPLQVREDALVACGRHCCLCHKFCGTKIIVHHIRLKSEGEDNTFDNAIALCFDCNADMSSYDHKHPVGTKYSESEVKKHRDSWYEKVKGNLGIADKTEAVETDKRIYQVLLKMLPWEGSILFLKEHDFGNVYETSRLNEFWRFLDRCNDPAFEFLDPDLEGLRVDLQRHMNQLVRLLCSQTYPTHRKGWSRVPEEWNVEQPPRWRHVIRSLNSRADEVWGAYSTLVRTATRKLGVLPEEMA